MNFALNIEKSCRLYPDKTCVVQEDIRLTFRQMEGRANRLARALVEMGLKPGDRVAIFQTNCFQFCEMLYAVGKAAGIFINLNFRFRGEEATYILNNCTPKVLILGDRYTELIKDIRPNLPSIERYIVIGAPPADFQGYEALLSRQPGTPFPSLPGQEDDTACLIYTSGTTGHPKGAMITQANIKTPLTEKVVTTYLVPTMLQGILDHPDFSKKDLSSLRHIGYGASPMPVNLLLRAKELLRADFTNFFGLTESTGIVSVLSPEDHRLEGSPEEVAEKTRRLSGIGRSIPEGEVRIVDDQDRDVPPGTVGEIVARGKKVMKGYWNKPKETEETLRGGWLHTGDLASMDEDGYLFLAGRKKDMIIRGGENIYPVEIENVLHSHPKILEAAVIGVPDPYWGEIVKAVIVLRPGEQALAKEIIDYCHEKLASYKKPALVEFVAALPKNAMQKVLKNVLRGEKPQ